MRSKESDDARENRVQKVLRIARRKVVRKTRRLGRSARRWFKSQMRRQRLARAEPRPVALLEYARTPGNNNQAVQARLVQEIEQHGLNLACAAIHSAISLCGVFDISPRVQRTLYVAAIRAIATVDRARAAAFGEQYLAELYDPRAAHTLVTLHKILGNYERALTLLDDLPRDEWYQTTLAVLRSRSLEARLRRDYGDALRAALRIGPERVVQVADELLAAAGEEERVLGYRVLRSELGKEFSANRKLSALLLGCAQELAALNHRNDFFALAACDTHLYLGSLHRARLALEQLGTGDARITSKLARVSSLERLLQQGFRYSPAPPVDPYSPEPGRVLCALHNSLPYNSGGYATRTHGLLSALVRLGWNVSGVTRLGYPQDLPAHRDLPFEASSRVGAVSYFRVPGRARATMEEHLAAFTDELLRLALQEQPQLLHACSNHVYGLAACAVARALGVKSVYEVRGLWEITRISRQPDWEGTEYFNLMSRMELQAALEADAVICITRALRDEMIRRGVPAEKITVVPNGVDVERFVPRPRNEVLAERLGVSDKRVIGYVGSVVDYEGLDLLLRAVDLLRNRGAPGFALLIVGDGAALEGLRSLAAELCLGDLVTFTGRVPHEQVEDYYSIVDVVPLPRKSLPVTEMVSPLKPFEAMAMDKIVVASDVAALAEIVQDGINGLLCRKDDVGDLADKLEMVLDPAFAHSLRPREWVIANRSWQHLSTLVQDVYRSLTSPLLPLPQVAIQEALLSPAFETTRTAYRERYAGEGEKFLRLDDYVRWSYVASRLPAGSSLLDVGVGVGQFLNTLAAGGTFERLVGVDLQPHSKFLRLHDGFAMDYVSIDRLEYRDGEFDIVTCMETLEHLPDRVFVEGLRQLRRVCRGRLIVTVPFREEKLGTGHVRRFDLVDLERLFPGAAITVMHRRSRANGRKTYWALIEEDVGGRPTDDSVIRDQ
jgi:glycosyltransferase involved in cell wall biosynthesis